MVRKAVLLGLVFSASMLIPLRGTRAAEESHKAFLTRIQEAKTTAVFLTAVFHIQDEAERVREFRQYGTGFVIDTSSAPGLRIVTNRHIVELQSKPGIFADQILAKVNLEGAHDATYFQAILVKEEDFDQLPLVRGLRGEGGIDFLAEILVGHLVVLGNDLAEEPVFESVHPTDCFAFLRLDPAEFAVLPVGFSL